MKLMKRKSSVRYGVRTDMATLFRLRMLLKRIGLEELLKSGKIDKSDVMGSIIASIEDENLLYEFCQIVTGKNDHDWSGEQFGTICGVIDDFFVDLWSQMPASWRGQIAEKVQLVGSYLTEIGRAIVLSRSVDGGTTQTTGATM